MGSSQHCMSQPFYRYDEQNDEQYYIIDNDTYDNTIDNAQDGPSNYLDHEPGVIENTTVEAVKHRLINDPTYRRELLERVLPQFAKLNEQFANSFLKSHKDPTVNHAM